MARAARKKSSTGIYHIMIRGINREKIYQDDRDKKKFIEIMKKICGEYGSWYNIRHHRVGHVFQDRFKSECIEANAYFITVLKYIINNPVKSKNVEKSGDYKWSSYSEYTKKNTITDTQFYLKMLDDNERKAKIYFKEAMKKEELQIINLNFENVRRTDKEAEEIIKEEMKNKNIENIGEETLGKRIALIKTFKSKGISSRQIIEITGLNKSKVIGI